MGYKGTKDILPFGKGFDLCNKIDVMPIKTIGDVDQFLIRKSCARRSMAQKTWVGQNTMHIEAPANIWAPKTTQLDTYWAFVKVRNESGVKINRVVIKATDQFEAYMLLKAIYGDILLSKSAHPTRNIPATAR